MSPRFEVLHNGHRVCVAGVNGDGVISIGVTYVKRINADGSIDFHAGGLGYYQGKTAQQHVNWAVPAIGIGDEITIRIQPGGEIDPPADMTPHPKCTVEDPEFGTLNFSIDAWDGDIPFPCPPFVSAHVHLPGDESGPCNSHRILIQEFIRRHSRLWPEIAAALLRCSGRHQSITELTAYLSTHISIDLPADSNDLSLTYQLDSEPAELAYGMTLRNWEVVEVYALH